MWRLLHVHVVTRSLIHAEAKIGSYGFEYEGYFLLKVRDLNLETILISYHFIKVHFASGLFDITVLVFFPKPHCKKFKVLDAVLGQEKGK